MRTYSKTLLLPVVARVERRGDSLGLSLLRESKFAFTERQLSFLCVMNTVLSRCNWNELCVAWWMLHEIAVHRYGHRSSTELPLWLCSQSTEWASSVGVDSIAVVYQATSNKSNSFTFIFSYMMLDSCHVGVVSSGLATYYINTGDECSRGYALAEELAANYWDLE